MHIFWITLLISGLVTLTCMTGWTVLHLARSLARMPYHWRYAKHVIGDWEPIPELDTGAMTLTDELMWRQQYGGWNSGAMLPAPPPDDDWPAEADPHPGPPTVTVDWVESFPRWEEPTRTATPLPPGLAADLRAQDNDAAAFMADQLCKFAEIRMELARKLTAA